jgi:hypothetical protein
MSVIGKLASSLNRRDEFPNQELAKSILHGNDKKAVKELFELLHHKEKAISSDCIKVIYELATEKPELITTYARDLIALLDNKNNRLQWGAMIAIQAITSGNPKQIYAALPKIIASADKGTVITNDHCVGILIKLCAVNEYEEDAFELLLERIKISPTNQLPMYAENAIPVIKAKNKTAFINTLKSRLVEIEKDTKRKRVEKVISKVIKLP